MKKITLLAAVLVTASFASCKKDRVCSCKSDQPGATADEITFIDAKKSQAKANCLSYSYSYDNGTATQTVKVTCELK